MNATTPRFVVRPNRRYAVWDITTGQQIGARSVTKEQAEQDAAFRNHAWETTVKEEGMRLTVISNGFTRKNLTLESVASIVLNVTNYVSVNEYAKLKALKIGEQIREFINSVTSTAVSL